MKLFVFGLGYSARAVVERMRPRLDAVWGTTRGPGNLREIEALGITPILFDGVANPPSPGRLGGGSNLEPAFGDSSASHSSPGGGEFILEALAQSTHVLVSVPPDPAGDPVLPRYRAALAAARPRSLVYLSTVGVYGDQGGAWVGEASECRPVSNRSRQRLSAEAAWQDFGRQTGVPVAIIRLAGIYGPGRGPFEKIRQGTARRILKPGQVFNRIHVDDVAAIVEAAFARRADGVFNGVDDEPAPPQDVLGYAAELLGVPPPPELPYEEAELTPMARSFYGESKRVRNDKIKRELGIRLAYPTYREGLRAVLRAEAERLAV